MTWSPQDLDALDPEELHQIAKKAATCVVLSRLLVGRCLLSMMRTRSYQRQGCSSEVHYAILVLGVKHEEALECKLIASRWRLCPLSGRRLKVVKSAGRPCA